MTLEELQNEAKQDIHIDTTKMELVASENAKLYVKWATYLSEYKKEAIALTKQLTKAQNDAMMHYTGRGEDVCLDVFDKTELRAILPNWPDTIKAKTALMLVETKMDFIKDTMDAIKARGFNIRAIVDLRKFESGA